MFCTCVMNNTRWVQVVTVISLHKRVSFNLAMNKHYTDGSYNNHYLSPPRHTHQMLSSCLDFIIGSSPIQSILGEWCSAMVLAWEHLFCQCLLQKVIRKTGLFFPELWRQVCKTCMSVGFRFRKSTMLVILSLKVKAQRWHLRFSLSCPGFKSRLCREFLSMIFFSWRFFSHYCLVRGQYWEVCKTNQYLALFCRLYKAIQPVIEPMAAEGNRKNMLPLGFSLHYSN